MRGRAADSERYRTPAEPDSRPHDPETPNETDQSVDGNLAVPGMPAQEATTTTTTDGPSFIKHLPLVKRASQASLVQFQAPGSTAQQAATTNTTDGPSVIKHPPLAKRASQASLVQGKGILKSGTSFPTKEASQRPEPFAESDRRPSYSAPPSSIAEVKPTGSEPARKTSLPSYLPSAPSRRLSFADEISEQRSNREKLETVHLYSVNALPINSAGSKEKLRDERESSTVETGAPPVAMVAAAPMQPVGRAKRVSIDPVDIIKIVTPEVTSSQMSESSEMLRTLPLRRHSSDRGAPAATPRQADVPAAAGHQELSSSSSSRDNSSDQADQETPARELRASVHSSRSWRYRKRPLTASTVSAPEPSRANAAESDERPAPRAQRAILDDNNSSVGRRGLQSFIHDEPIEHGPLSDRQPLLSTTTLVAVQKPRYPRLLAAGVIVVVATLAVAIVSLLISSRFLVPVLAKNAVCDTDDCTEHARHLVAKMNTSANPCHDFHAYVCGKGIAAGPAVPSVIRTARQQGREMVLALSHARFVLFAKHRSTAAFKTLRTLDACTGRDADQSPEHLAAFMRHRGMCWPEIPNITAQIRLAHVLDTLFDLAVNWRLALWFDVRVSYLGVDGRLVMTLGEPGPVPIYRMEQLSDLAEGSYGNLVRAVASLLTKGKVHLKEGAINELRSDESAIRDAVLSSEDPDEHDDWLVTHDTGLGLNVSSGEWKALVNKYLDASGFSAASNVGYLVAQQHRLKALATALSAVPPERLARVVGWTFAYTYVWMVDPTLDTFQEWGAASSSEDFTPHALCFLAVHESHGITMAAPMFRETFNAAERGRVVAVLNRTAEALTGILRDSSVIAADTKRDAALKIAVHVYRSFWPPEPFSHFEVLDLLYGAFPNDTRSFFAAWLESRKALRASAGNRYYASLMLARYRWRSARVLYLYALNLVLLGLAAVFPPSYLSRGSHVMTYAGLGFQLARQLVRTVDERGRSRDHAGRPLIWRTRIGSASRECRLSKANTSAERRSLADLFALDLSVAAMKTAAAVDESPLQLKSLEGLSAAQTFYVSYCSHFCDEEPVSQARSMCNLAANSSDFAQAFDCPAGDVTASKCLFF